MFIDRARIKVTGGAGGNGCCSFRREKYVPRGGPDGGDGGNGGDVVIVANSRYTSLLDLRYHHHLKGERGEHGQGAKCHGKRGQALMVPVPCGTVVRNFETGEMLADLVEEGQTFVAGRGGRGGRGNARFATATRKAPRFSELGEPGEEAEYLIELKLIAEVGLVGLPNAGKSTFLSVVSAASPKIADYPFTTLSPNLGVASLSDHRTLTLADIPGIIEGAAEGKGLGHDFLRHIERTKVLLFIIDLGDDDPLATLQTLEAELAEHSEAFAKRPRVLALNKADLPENRERFEALAPQLDNAFCISGMTREGVADLLEHLWFVVDRVRREEEEVEEAPREQEYIYTAPFTIEQTDDGYQVDGKAILRLVRMTDFSNEEALRHLQESMQQMGLFKALKRLGAQRGDTIHIGDTDLEYEPD